MGWFVVSTHHWYRCSLFLDLVSLNIQDPKHLVYFSFLTKGKYFNDILSKKYLKYILLLAINTWPISDIQKSLSNPHFCSKMSQETAHVAMLIAALKAIDKWAADVLNAYITTPCYHC